MRAVLILAALCSVAHAEDNTTTVRAPAPRRAGRASTRPIRPATKRRRRATSPPSCSARRDRVDARAVRRRARQRRGAAQGRRLEAPADPARAPRRRRRRRAAVDDAAVQRDREGRLALRARRHRRQIVGGDGDGAGHRAQARATTPLHRDVILALTGDEESGGAGIRYILDHRKELVGDAEFALNEGGGVMLDAQGKARLVSLGTAEKTFQDYQLVAHGTGGHSSVPNDENAIYRLTHALDKLAAFKFPTQLTPAVRDSLRASAVTQPEARAKAMRAAADVKGDVVRRSTARGDRRASAGARDDAHDLRGDADVGRHAGQRAARRGARDGQLPHHAGRHDRGGARRAQEAGGRARRRR